MNGKIGYKTLWRFFLPLWFSGFLQAFTGNLINSGLARMDNSAVLLAAFALAGSLMQTIISPMHMIRPTVSALTKNRDSYLVVRRFTAMLTGTMALVMGILAWTGVIEWILIRLMEVNRETTESTVIIFKMLIFYPLGLLMKDFFIGVLIRLEMTYLGIFGSIARTLYLFFIIGQVDRLSFLTPQILAACIFILAPLVEGLTLFVLIRLKAGSIPNRISLSEDPQAPIMQIPEMLRFYGPLAFMAFLNALSKPLINGSLSRLSGDITLLAAFAVGFGVVMNLVFPLRLLHQVSLRYGNEDGKRVLRFSLFIGLFICTMVFLVGYTPLGMLILGRWIGVEENLITHARILARLLVPLPLIIVLREFTSGLIYDNRETGIIGRSKFIYTAVLALSLPGWTLLGQVNVLVAAALAILSAESTETVFILYNFRRNRRKKDHGPTETE